MGFGRPADGLPPFPPVPQARHQPKDSPRGEIHPWGRSPHHGALREGASLALLPVTGSIPPDSDSLSPRGPKSNPVDCPGDDCAVGKLRLTLKRRRLLLVGSVLLPAHRARPQQIPSWKGQRGASARALRLPVSPTPRRSKPCLLLWTCVVCGAPAHGPER